MNITDQLAQALEEIHNHEARRSSPDTAYDTGMMTRAREALEAYRASKEGEVVEYRALVWNVDQFQKGDEFQVDGEWRPSPEKNYGLTYCGAYLPHRRPIRAT